MECVRRCYKENDWKKYIAYLKQWARTHASLAHAGQSPVCYDEWYDNEHEDLELEIVLGFNSKQWWVYSNMHDVYIDPPKEVLDSLPDWREDRDKSEKAFQKIIDTDPDWLYNKDYWYSGDDTEI